MDLLLDFIFYVIHDWLQSEHNRLLSPVSIMDPYVLYMFVQN